MLLDLITKNRSYRRFYQNHKIERNLLFNLINLARLSASAKNSQPLKYYISNDAIKNEQIFSTLAWAGFLKNWDGPIEGEKPSAYIIVIIDKNITENNYCDHGIATQSILLGAVEKDLGGCIIAAINKKKLSKILNLQDNLEILQVIALGKPKEIVVIDEINNGEDTKYWRDENAVHHVPKRKLKDIII